MSDNDIVIHVVDQMYELDSFSEEAMMNWEEIPNNNKTWTMCQQFFEAAYIASKSYMDAKGQKQEQANKITKDHIQLYLMAKWKLKHTKTQKNAKNISSR